MTDDRRMLSDTLNRYLAGKYGWEHRAKAAYQAPFHDPARWAELSELGVLMALAPEDQGGFGGAGFDITAVFEALGRAICPEPVLAALLSSRLLAAAGADQEALLAGAVHHAAALGELDAPYDLSGIATTARKDGEGYRLSGRKSVVYGGHVAERFLVAALLDGTMALFDVAASDAEVTPYGMIDGGGAAEVFLDAAPATLLLAEAGAAVQDALDAGTLALCAEAVGAMDVSFDITLDYLKSRKQFGTTIGSFQALQHRMVDMKTEIEQARSITILAASRIGTGAQSRSVSMAKNLIGRTAKLVAEDCVQMHGGIAMTWEYQMSHYAKRLVMIDHQLGDTDHHLERVMATRGV
ncbi:acyl-CoA dehydrogenase family protein [Anianabacter salinae]|uniref:acyl-CoA dehydrogenase family protein n=1 Tax=Anianabacter salinae TaxID=2851023 RepID=UPI002B20A02D|nr:acyl-CoA dehydrogenase family protein [Anianabacter salinae]